MKLKYYLRGCGVGILVTVIILMIALKAKGGVMTDKRVMERASELGMVMQQDTKEQSDTQKISEMQEASETQEVSETQKTLDAQEPSVSRTDTEQKQTDDSGKSTQAEEHEQLQEEKQEASEDGIAITVKNGEVCRDVAAKLFDNGLVEDAEEFRIYMGDHGYAKKLRVGSFFIKKGMSYEEIAKILTEKS
ncbi:MAG: hypothetical protein ACI4FX_06610 [Agathobacter sp.]